MTPEVSVIVPSYNHARFISNCLSSLEANFPAKLQVILIDDSSKDETAAIGKSIIERWGPPHLFVLHSKNQGVCKTLNHGLELATGKYIAFLASDDAWPTDRLSRMIAKLNEGFDGCLGDIQTMEVDGAHKSIIRQPLPNGRMTLSFEDVLFWRSHINLQSGLFRRDALMQAGAFDDQYTFEDIDFFLRFTRHHRLGYLPGVSVLYRVTPGGLSRKPRLHGDSLIALIESHLTGSPLSDQSKAKARGLAWLKLAESNYNNLLLSEARRAAFKAVNADLRLLPKAARIVGRSLLGEQLIDFLRRRNEV